MTTTPYLVGDDEIVRHPPTSWLQPLELSRTAIRAFFSTTIGAYTDRRDSMAGLARPFSAPSEDAPDTRIMPGTSIDAQSVPSADNLWIDFAADLGDGFDATYALASLLARAELRVQGLPSETLQRADILVLGGDLVYPTPTRHAYRDRLVGPLRAALRDPPLSRAPSIFAIPGNHDWYDGLTNFIRTFCQGGPIGGWRLWQSRSYFAVKLPGRWWLWGIDVQFSHRIDPTQLRYFMDLSRGAEHTKDDPRLKDGDHVILVTSKPSWLGAEEKDDSFLNLQFFEQKAITEAGASASIVLAGDLHHYARFADARGNQRITCGGGGAYLRATHHLPRRLDLRLPPSSPEQRLPDGADRASLRGRKAPGGGARRSGSSGPEPGGAREFVESGVTYPDRYTSRRLVFGALRLPLLPQNWSFVFTLGAVYVWLAVLVNRVGGALGGFVAYLRAVWDSLALSPAAALAAGMVLLASGTFAVVANPRARAPLAALWGVFHGALHVASAVSIGWLISDHVLPYIGMQTWPLYATLLGAIVVAGIHGGSLIGLYFVVSDLLWGWHDNEVFVCQNILDYRSFLRIHVQEDRVTLYPIGLRHVPRRWRRRVPDETTDLRRAALKAGEAEDLDWAIKESWDVPDPDPTRLEPASGTPLAPHLIEGPVVITLDGVAPPSGAR